MLPRRLFMSDYAHLEEHYLAYTMVIYKKCIYKLNQLLELLSCHMFKFKMFFTKN